MSIVRRVAALLAAVAALVPVLFLVNGLLLAAGTTPRAGSVAGANAGVSRPDGLTLMSFNIAKGFAYLGRARFASPVEVRARMDGIAALVRAEHPDYLFLSEAAWESGPGSVNQITYLASATGLTNWVFGENFCLGVPGYRMISGNAVLSRGALRGIANPDLPGRRPFFVTRNNRRALVAETEAGGAPLRLYSLHNDSFVPTNNLAQVHFLLAHAQGMPAVFAGDFNAASGSDSLQALRQSGRFAGEWSGPPTIPNIAPDRAIDFILAPSDWTLREHRVLTNSLSDHCAVVSRFSLRSP